MDGSKTTSASSKPFGSDLQAEHQQQEQQTDYSGKDLSNMTKSINVIDTGLITAHMRANESSRPDKIIDDPYAEALSNDIPAQVINTVMSKWGSQQRNLVNFMAIRTRYLDEALASRPSSIHQVMILASGMDTRAHRLETLQDCLVIEVDQSTAMFERKQKILAEKQAPVLAKDHHYVIADLANDDWETALISNGFNPKEPTFWCMEGLLYYLDKGSLIKLMKTIDALSVAGSMFWADMGGSVLIKEAEPLIKYGENTPLEGILSLTKWDLKIAASLSESGRHFGRDWEPQLTSDTQEPIPWVFVHGTKSSNPHVDPLL